MDDWSRKVTWMREVRAAEATFAPTGELLSVKLEPALPSHDDEDRPQRESPAEALKRLNDERNRIVFGASGRLVPRAPRRDPNA